MPQGLPANVPIPGALPKPLPGMAATGGALSKPALPTATGALGKNGPPSPIAGGTGGLGGGGAGSMQSSVGYTVQDGEELGTIAQKFGLPGWKYLYQLNEQAIGDNPDLLQAGTVLTIPRWDATGGDELIEARGGRAFEYSGGTCYRYPWVLFSITIGELCGDSSVSIEIPTTYELEDNEDQTASETDLSQSSSETSTGDAQLVDVSEGRDVEITSTLSGDILFSGHITQADEIVALLPHTPHYRVGIRGIPLIINGQLHRHSADVQ